jgi:hypothetical protein
MRRLRLMYTSFNLTMNEGLMAVSFNSSGILVEVEVGVEVA